MPGFIKFLFRTGFLCFLASAPVVTAAEQDGENTGNASSVSQPVLAYFSLRNVSGEENADDYYGDDRAELSLGYCELKHTPVPFTATKSFKSLARNGYFYVPETSIDVQSVRRLEADPFWDSLLQSVGNQRPVLYIHGYNMSFARSCKQASLFEQKLESKQRVMLFSWPSDGALLNYTRDEADVQWSVSPMERGLKQMQQRFGSGGFDVVAHSLGARGLLYALNSLAHNSDQDRPILNNLVLIAPDVDAGIFRQILSGITPLVRNISLYVSTNDKPLALSAEVHGYPRLGQAGPHLAAINGVEIIDLSGLEARSFSGHLYHLYNDDIAADLRLLLDEQQRADNRPNLHKVADGYWRISSAE